MIIVSERTDALFNMLEASKKLENSIRELSESLIEIVKASHKIKKSFKKKIITRKEFLIYLKSDLNISKFRVECFGFPDLICKNRLFNFNVILAQLADVEIKEDEEIPILLEA